MDVRSGYGMMLWIENGTADYGVVALRGCGGKACDQAQRRDEQFAQLDSPKMTNMIASASIEAWGRLVG